MSFCPHCGTSLAEQADTCSACGEAIATAAAKPKGRFKGTMIAMGGGQAPASAGAAVPPSPQVPAVPAKPAPAPPPPLGTIPNPPPAPAGQSKKKHGTMLGVGTPGLGPVGQPQPPGPPANAPEATPAAAPADETAMPPSRNAAASQRTATSPSSALARAPQPQAERAISAVHAAPRVPREGRFVVGSIPPAPPMLGTGKLIAIGLGGIVLIAAAGYAMALFLGLVH